MRIISILSFILLFSSVANAQTSTLPELLDQAMQSSIRTEAETKRDKNRKPLKTLQFFGIEPDMKVLELIPGGGWYSKLLGPVLRERGELYMALGTSFVEKNVLSLEGMDKAKVLTVDAKITASDTPGLRSMEGFALSEKNFDAVLTFRNLHNFDAAGRAALNNAAYKALKKGGIYGVVDHTRRHMEPQNPENGRRADPVLIIKEVQAAGFELVDFSDLHYRADDELRYEVGRKSVTGNTDRFTLLFRKAK